MIDKQKKFHYTPEEREQATKDLAEFVEDMVCAFGGFADLPKTPVKITEDPRCLRVKIPIERHGDMGVVFGPNGSNVISLLHFIRNQQILKHNKILHLSFETMIANGTIVAFQVDDYWVFTNTGATIPNNDYHVGRGAIPPHIKADKIDLYRVEASDGERTIPARDMSSISRLSTRYELDTSLKFNYGTLLNFDFGTQLVSQPDMSVNRYQQLAGETAIYPNRGSNVEYAVLGLCSESGEVAGVLKKIIRDEGGELTAEGRNKLAKELGDVTWYCAALAHELGIPLSRIMADNIQKLQDRKERNVLNGSGDNR
jgi:NTP pyrophosphatase (non-canonical NTP hydrolase)